MTSRNKRWRLFADSKIQGLLCARVAGYWIACQLAMIVTMCGIASMTEGTGTDSRAIWKLIVPGWMVSSLLLPIMLLDIVAFSNRFVGPIFNFRRRFKQLAEDGSAGEIRFRPGDYFLDLSENFNQLRERLKSESIGSSDGFTQAECSAPIVVGAFDTLPGDTTCTG